MQATEPLIPLWYRFAPWLAVIYCAGVVLMLIRLAVSITAAHRLGAQATQIITGRPNEILNGLAKQWSLKVVPKLAVVEAAVIPQVVGLFRSTILLPASAISGLSSDELEMILAHELAHVRRHDMWVNLLQRLVEAVLFFNPALWFLSRRISALREYCCDELACEAVAKQAQQGEPRLRYAQALLRVVELKQDSARTEQVAALAASGRSPSELRQRVARLFGEPLREPVLVSHGAVRAAIVLSLCSVAWLFTPVLAQLSDEPSKEAATSKELAIKYLNDVPKGAVQVVLPHKGALRLIAITEPRGSHWWTPAGEKISGNPEWQRFKKNYSTEKLIAVLEAVHPNAIPPSAAIGPVGQKWKIPYYAAAPVSFSADGTPIITAGFGAGPWAPLGKVVVGASLGDSGFMVHFDEFNSQNGVASCRVDQVPEMDFALVCVDKNGSRGKLGVTGNLSYALDSTKITWTLSQHVLGLEPKAFSHIEVLTRSRAWAEFSGFAVEPKPIATEVNSRVLETSKNGTSDHSAENDPQNNAEPQAEDAGRDATWEVLVKVVDKSTGEPIANPRVWFRLGGRGGETIWHDGDANGRLSGQFPIHTPPECVLKVRAEGYAAMQAEWLIPKRILMGELPEQFTFEMTKSITVGGTIVDEDNQPVVGAEIDFAAVDSSKIDFPTVDPAKAIWPRIRYGFGFETYTTDEQGNWRRDIASTKIANVRMKIRHPDFACRPFKWGLRNEYVQKLLDLSYQVKLPRGFVVSGRVVDEDGNPLAGVQLASSGYGGKLYSLSTSLLFAETDAQGRYQLERLSLRNSDYPDLTIRAIKPGYTPALEAIPGFSNVPLGKSTEDQRIVDFQMSAGAIARVEVADSDGRPISGVSIRPVSWQGGDVLGPLGEINAPDKTDEDGVWEWKWAPRGSKVEYDITKTGHVSILKQAIAAQDSAEPIKLVLKRPQVIIGKGD